LTVGHSMPHTGRILREDGACETPAAFLTRVSLRTTFPMCAPSTARRDGAASCRDIGHEQGTRCEFAIQWVWQYYRMMRSACARRADRTVKKKQAGIIARCRRYS